LTKRHIVKLTIEFPRAFEQIFLHKKESPTSLPLPHEREATKTVRQYRQGTEAHILIVYAVSSKVLSLLVTYPFWIGFLYCYKQTKLKIII